MKLVEYADASPEVRVVYADIMQTRGVDWISNYRNALANEVNRASNGLRVELDLRLR